MPVVTADSSKQSEDEFFKVVTDADKKNYIMAASCSVKNDIGLYTNHVYTLLGTYHLVGGPQVLKMRNPHGHGSEKYKGGFSDDDPNWTEAWKKQVNFVKANDGVFFISLKDFKTYFKWYAIALYQDWHKDHHEVRAKGMNHMWEMSTPVDQDAAICLDYESKRQVPHSNQCRSEFGFHQQFYGVYVNQWKADV